MASEDPDEIDWLEEEDPDANVEIYKESNEINLKVSEIILPYQEIELTVDVVPLKLVQDVIDLNPVTFKYAMGPMPPIPEIPEIPEEQEIPEIFEKEIENSIDEEIVEVIEEIDPEFMPNFFKGSDFNFKQFAED